MMHRHFRAVMLLLSGCVALIACQPPPGVNGCQDAVCPGSPDAGEPDAGEPDAGEPDAGEPDAGEPDAGEPDAGEPDACEPDGGVVSPLIITTKPRNNEQGVSPLATLNASFSRPMDVGSFDTKTFTVVRQEGASLVLGELEAAERAVSFRLPPNRSLALLETYISTLTREVRDATCTPLAEEHTWSFKTRDGRWSISSELAMGAKQGASSARVAMDDAGGAIAVWLRREGEHMDLWSNRYTRAGGWGVPTLLEEEDRWSAGSPRVAMTPSGGGLAVWLQLGNGVQSVWARSYNADSGWSSAQPISSSLGDASEPALALDPSGHAVAVWTMYDDVTSTTRVWASTFAPGRGWKSPLRIEGDRDGESFSPHVAIDETGHFIATWVRKDEDRYSVWVNHGDDSGWAGEQPIDLLNGAPASSPRVSVRGRAFVVWAQYEGEPTRRAIRASRFVPNEGWSTAQTIDAGGESASQPRLVIDARGNALALWTQPWMGRAAVWANRYEVGTGWETAHVISPEGGEDSSCAELAVDSRGHALAVWLQRDVSSYPSIWSSRYVAGQKWQAPALIDDVQFGEASCPWVDLNGDGFGFAVWPQSTSTDMGIYFNRFE
ncbi:Ig-like domain-containing protein [Archangium violaceum]|uniref:Ig-like domain-containing protein n=1 Tax=Archangium violaceum TaxID=83451 RepID=UPI0036DECDE3